MIDLETARRIILENTPRLAPRRVALLRALGSVLAENVAAPEPIPAFDSSAMDGFCVLCQDVDAASDSDPVTLKVQEEIQAGSPPRHKLRPGCAARIMTGAQVPVGAKGAAMDRAVVMKEYAQDLGESIRIKHPVKAGDHIRPRGEEYQAGEAVLMAGTTITPPVVGLLAALDAEEVAVFGKPAVAVIATGNELRPPGTRLEPGQIRDTNSPALAAALQAMDLAPVSVESVPDDRGEIATALEGALEKADAVISVGGVSVGDFDLVREVAEEIGVETRFWRVAIKPGKPNYFGTRDEKLLFGLPGNPVSALVSFYELVRPALAKLAGAPGAVRPLIKARLESELSKKTERLEMVRGRLARNEAGEWSVKPCRGQGSHMLGGLAGADCLIEFPKDKNRIIAGGIVNVEPLDWRNP
jgi:molybdopterin molybdotransferase